MQDSWITGVRVEKLNIHHDYRGKVMKFFGSGEVGEVYFATVRKDKVKAWHLHKEMELNYVCVHGAVLLVLIDMREGSSTQDDVMEIILSPENYVGVHIPPGVLNGFKGLADGESVVCNVASMYYDPNDIEKTPIKDIYYDWFKVGE